MREGLSVSTKTDLSGNGSGCAASSSSKGGSGSVLSNSDAAAAVAGTAAQPGVSQIQADVSSSAHSLMCFGFVPVSCFTSPAVSPRATPNPEHRNNPLPFGFYPSFLPIDGIPVSQYLFAHSAPVSAAPSKPPSPTPPEDCIRPVAMVPIAASFPMFPVLCDIPEELKEEDASDDENTPAVVEDAMKCPVCGITCGTTSLLKTHIVHVHVSGPSFLCKHCGTSFSSSSKLRSHLFSLCGGKRSAIKFGAVDLSHFSPKATHHPPGKQFRCQFSGCGKTFSQRSNLLRHQRSHLGDYRHKCPVPGCGAGFTRSDAMSNHAYQQHGVTPCLCPFQGCFRSFVFKEECDEHRASHKHPQTE